MGSVNNLMPRMLAAAFLVTVLAPCALAQPAASDAASDEGRRDCRRASGLERRRCEGEISAAQIPPGTTDDSGSPEQPGEFQLPLVQISKDLRYLQTATGFLSQAASQSGEIDFEAVARTASEVRKRAARLKVSLALPKSEKSAKYAGEKFPLDAAQLRPALSALSALISDAVRNPVLRGSFLDARRSAVVRSELDEIVRLSERIKMSSELLGKNRQ